jgi:hypothetical protein
VQNPEVLMKEPSLTSLIAKKVDLTYEMDNP